MDQRIMSTLYKTLIIPILIYGSETWTMTGSTVHLHWLCEQNELRKLYYTMKNVDAHGRYGWIMGSTKAQGELRSELS